DPGVSLAGGARWLRGTEWRQLDTRVAEVGVHVDDVGAVRRSRNARRHVHRPVEQGPGIEPERGATGTIGPRADHQHPALALAERFRQVERHRYALDVRLAAERAAPALERERELPAGERPAAHEARHAEATER